MGWLKALHGSIIEPQLETLPGVLHVHATDVKVKRKKDANSVYSHIEASCATQHQPQRLAFADPDTPNDNLPFISAAEFASFSGHHKHNNGNNNSNNNNGEVDNQERGRLYLAIDNIVYDCTQFVHDHPGGPRVIGSFSGQDCSWQFWRFHSKENMEEWGRPLRVARTKGVKNRWKERPRFVGLKGLGEEGEKW